MSEGNTPFCRIRLLKAGFVSTLYSSSSKQYCSLLALDGPGTAYLDDSYRIWTLDMASKKPTYLAGGNPGFKDGPLASAAFGSMDGIFVVKGTSGTVLLVADRGNHLIRAVSSTGVTTLIGKVPPSAGSSVGGQASTIRLASPKDVVADSKGNVYFAQDSGEYRIWKYTP